MSFLRWPDDPAEAVRHGVRIFDAVAPRYDLMRRLVSGGFEERWKRRTLADALAGRPPRRVLDVAAGTGDVARLVLDVAPGARILAVDANAAMIARGRAKTRAAAVRWVRADLNRLPATPARFDLVTVAYGLRYCPDLPAFLGACRRALVPGGTFWAFDLGRPPSAPWRATWFAYLFLTGTILGTLLHARPATYWHLVESLRAYPGQRGVTRLLAEAGFAGARHVDLVGGVLAAHVARAPEPDGVRCGPSRADV